MEIKIANQLAVLKKGTSFEYVAENRLFSGSDGYTLTITFPLRQCPQNLAIFGHINRADVAARKVIFDCEIRHGKFYKFGSVTVNEINEAEVKCQFLEGRSEQNFENTFDKIYINELDLGQWPTGKPNPTDAWSPLSYPDAVALPWVNDASGNIQNCAEYHEVIDEHGQNHSYYAWHADTRSLSWQPYLIYIVRKIAEAVGYTIDLSAWSEVEEYKYLLICNCLPSAWHVYDFARALPHWSVAEFFEKLELILGGEFEINHRTQSISFAFSRNVLEGIEPIHLQNVVDDHSVEVEVEEAKCEYLEAKNLVYKECDHAMWKYYSCDWFVKYYKQSATHHASMQALLNATRGCQNITNGYGRGSAAQQVHYVEDMDMYFVVRCLRKELIEARGGWMPNRYKYICILQPVNEFGGRIVDDREDAEEVEIEFVPVRVDETDETFGPCMFLSFSGYDEDYGDTGTSGTGFRTDPETRKQEIDATLYQPWPVQTLEGGERDKKSEYYDRVYIGFWDGALIEKGKLPHPHVSCIQIRPDWSFALSHFNLRINDRNLNARRTVYQIDPKQKVNFKFLSDSLPNPRAVFHIKGKKYVCEKLTATFTENGMSQLVKGVFYPIVG